MGEVKEVQPGSQRALMYQNFQGEFSENEGTIRAISQHYCESQNPVLYTFDTKLMRIILHRLENDKSGVK